MSDWEVVEMRTKLKKFRWRFLTSRRRKRVLWNLQDIQDYYHH